MNKVFIIGDRYFWACNGKEICNIQYTEWVGSKIYLKPFDGPRFRIEMIEPPPGRCPHCGGKV